MNFCLWVDDYDAVIFRHFGRRPSGIYCWYLSIGFRSVASFDALQFSHLSYNFLSLYKTLHSFISGLKLNFSWSPPVLTMESSSLSFTDYWYFTSDTHWNELSSAHHNIKPAKYFIILPMNIYFYISPPKKILKKLQFRISLFYSIKTARQLFNRNLLINIEGWVMRERQW